MTLTTITHDLKKFAKDFSDNKVRLINKNNVFNKKYVFLYSLLISKKLDNAFGDIIKEHILKAESIYPGTSFSIINDLFSSEKNFDSLRKKKSKFSDIKKYFYLNNIEKEHIEFFEKLISFSGPDSIINIHSSKLKNEALKRKESKFEINVNKDFYSIFFNKQKFVKRSCCLAIIDGFLEKDQHLIPALEIAKENNKTLVLVCRGMTKQVSNFLKSCILKNNITCLVYEKRFDNEDPFILEDMSIASDCTLIKDYTSLSREIKENIKVIDNLCLGPNFVSFQQKSSLVDKKVKELKNLNIKEEFLEKRIKRLSVNKTDVYCTDSDLIEFLKYAIKVYNKVIKFGIYESNNNPIPALEYDTIKNIKSDLEWKLKKIRYISHVNSKNLKVD